jgi:hypothetical protein
MEVLSIEDKKRGGYDRLEVLSSVKHSYVIYQPFGAEVVISCSYM